VGVDEELSCSKSKPRSHPMQRLLICVVTLITAFYASTVMARNFQDIQAQQELRAAEENTYEAPKVKGGEAPCRDEVKSGYPSAVGSGSKSHRAINQSKNGCEDVEEKKDIHHADADVDEFRSGMDLKVDLNEQNDPEAKHHDMEHPSRGAPSGIDQ
jgi:hypothetical protein